MSSDPVIVDCDGKKCEICHSTDWKYTCPRCLVHTCSVSCVRKHKLETQCSGERDKTSYVPLKEYNESNMMSDYTYLEDVQRQSDNMSRTNRDFISNYTKNKLKTLNRQANYLGIKHFSLPIGMTRHQQNQSNYNSKSRQIYWSIESIYYCNNEKHQYLEHGFPGNRTCNDFFQNILFFDTPRGKDSYSIIRHQLKYFIDAGLHQFKVALKKEKAPKGHFVDITDVMDMSFLDILRGEVIVEYPTLHIWLKSDPQPTDILLLEEKRMLVRPIKRSRQEDDNIKEGEKKQKLSIEEDDHITKDEQDQNDNRVKEKDEDELEVKNEDELEVKDEGELEVKDEDVIEAKEEYKATGIKEEGLSA